MGSKKAWTKFGFFGFSVVLPEGCVAIGRQRGSDGSRSVIGAPPSLSTPVGRCLIKRDVKWGRSIKARPSDKFDSPDSRLIPRRIAGGVAGGQDKTARFSGRSRFAEDDGPGEGTSFPAPSSRSAFGSSRRPKTVASYGRAKERRYANVLPRDGWT